jgi:hypothetical protein
LIQDIFRYIGFERKILTAAIRKNSEPSLEDDVEFNHDGIGRVIRVAIRKTGVEITRAISQGHRPAKKQ